MIETSRRGFLTGLVTLVAAPAIVRISNIMPVKSMEEAAFILGDGDRMPYYASAADIAKVVRCAFVPHLYVQMWKDIPLMAAIEAEISGA